MKHNHNHDNARSSDPQLVPVRFEFTHPTATSVCVTGTFNHWQPRSQDFAFLRCRQPVERNGSRGPGTYEYCLVVDGQWMPDPHATGSVPNPFGGRNSILSVASSPKAAHPADAENLPLKNANKKKI
jgi:1,4-alpha-glucan branching enzyme